jgi:hypothetical protein
MFEIGSIVCMLLLFGAAFLFGRANKFNDFTNREFSKLLSVVTMIVTTFIYLFEVTLGNTPERPSISFENPLYLVSSAIMISLGLYTGHDALRHWLHTPFRKMVERKRAREEERKLALAEEQKKIEQREDPSWVLEQVRKKVMGSLVILDAMRSEHRSWVGQIISVLEYLRTDMLERRAEAEDEPSVPTEVATALGDTTSSLMRDDRIELTSRRQLVTTLYGLGIIVDKAVVDLRDGKKDADLKKMQTLFLEKCHSTLNPPELERLCIEPKRSWWQKKFEKKSLPVAEVSIDSSYERAEAGPHEPAWTDTDAVLAASGVPTPDWEKELRRLHSGQKQSQ